MTERSASRIVPGALVLNTRVESWGPGKVLTCSGNTATVHFRDLPSGDNRRKLGLSFLALMSIQSDPVLDLVDLTKLGTIPGKGRRTKSRPRNNVGSLEQAIEFFLQKYPMGFEDADYLKAERNYKWASHERWRTTLGAGEGERLLAAGDVGEVCRRLAAVEGPTKFLHRVEKIALHEALNELAAMRPYLDALFALVEEATPSEGCFTAYANALELFPSRGQTNVFRWTAACVFPAMARPDTHLFVKPQCTRHCAARLGLELQYEPQPKWLTYRYLLDLAARLLETLQPRGARDLIDVQSFIWVTRDLP